MCVMVTQDLYVSAQQLDELMVVVADALEDTRAFNGCRSVDVFVDADHPGHVLLVEKWDNRADHDRYLDWCERQGPTKVSELVGSPDTGLRCFEPRPGV